MQFTEFFRVILSQKTEKQGMLSLKRKLIPFYVKAQANKMGYSLFMDRSTMEIFRVYNDNYRFFASARYWIYIYAGYWTLNKLTNINFAMGQTMGLGLLLILGVGVFGYVYGPFYQRALEKMELKPVYLTNDEFIRYTKAGRTNAVFMLGILAVGMIIGGAFILIYVMAPTFELLIIVLLGLFLIGALARSVPLTRLRLHYQKRYRKKIAAAVHEKMRRD